jgi:hypothetical protein
VNARTVAVTLAKMSGWRGRLGDAGRRASAAQAAAVRAEQKQSLVSFFLR